MKKGLIIAGVAVVVIIIIVLVVRNKINTNQNPVNTTPVNNNTQEPPDYTTETQTGYDAFITSCTAGVYGNSVASCNQAWCIAQNKGFQTWSKYKQWWNFCQIVNDPNTAFENTNCKIPDICKS